MKNSQYTKWALPKTPLWRAQLYWYELDRLYDRGYTKTISLSGTINPDPRRYRMVKYASK